MLNLNFLPDKEQQQVHLSLIWLILRNVMTWLFFTVLIISILLLWSKFFLEKALADVQVQSILVSGSNLPFTQQVERVNRQLTIIEQIQSEHVAWSEIFAALAVLLPPGNRLSSLYINSLDGQFVMEGLSLSREDLLALEGNLRQSQLIGQVKAPLSNLLNPVNINFKFSGEIRLLTEPAEKL